MLKQISIMSKLSIIKSYFKITLLSSLLYLIVASGVSPLPVESNANIDLRNNSTHNGPQSNGLLRYLDQPHPRNQNAHKTKPTSNRDPSVITPSSTDKVSRSSHINEKFSQYPSENPSINYGEPQRNWSPLQSGVASDNQKESIHSQYANLDRLAEGSGAGPLASDNGNKQKYDDNDGDDDDEDYDDYKDTSDIGSGRQKVPSVLSSQNINNMPSIPTSEMDLYNPFRPPPATYRDPTVSSNLRPDVHGHSKPNVMVQHQSTVRPSLSAQDPTRVKQPINPSTTTLFTTTKPVAMPTNPPSLAPMLTSTNFTKAKVNETKQNDSDYEDEDEMEDGDSEETSAFEDNDANDTDVQPQNKTQLSSHQIISTSTTRTPNPVLAKFDRTPLPGNSNYSLELPALKIRPNQTSPVISMRPQSSDFTISPPTATMQVNNEDDDDEEDEEQDDEDEELDDEEDYKDDGQFSHDKQHDAAENTKPKALPAPGNIPSFNSHDNAKNPNLPIKPTTASPSIIPTSTSRQDDKSMQSTNSNLPSTTPVPNETKSTNLINSPKPFDATMLLPRPSLIPTAIPVPSTTAINRYYDPVQKPAYSFTQSTTKPSIHVTTHQPSSTTVNPIKQIDFVTTPRIHATPKVVEIMTDDALTRQIYDKALEVYQETERTLRQAWETVWPSNMNFDSSSFEPLLAQPLFFMFALAGAVMGLVLLMMLVVFIITYQIQPRENDDISIY